MTPLRPALDDSCRNYVGNRALVSPIEGWGWSDDRPPSFEMELVDLVADDSGQLRGGSGRILEKDHKYDGYWVLFSARHQGTWNFTNQLGDYDLCINRSLPEDWKLHALEISFGSVPKGYSTCGYAVIGDPAFRKEIHPWPAVLS